MTNHFEKFRRGRSRWWHAVVQAFQVAFIVGLAVVPIPMAPMLAKVLLRRKRPEAALVVKAEVPNEPSPFEVAPPRNPGS